MFQHQTFDLMLALSVIVYVFLINLPENYLVVFICWTQVYAWGCNSDGQLGHSHRGTTTPRLISVSAVSTFLSKVASL